MKIWITYLISSLSALLFSVKHFKRFQMSSSEYKKYLKKSINLSLCYSSFVSKSSFNTFKKVGEIAFFSSCYDLVTDCKKYDPQLKKEYFNLLRKKTSNDVYKLTEDMYAKDEKNCFKNDGLERGDISFTIILLYLNSFEHFKQTFNISELGEICQITDDIIDYDEDKLLNETNCFLTERCNEHVQRYKNYFSTPQPIKLFYASPVMKTILKKSIVKLDQIVIDNTTNNKKILHRDSVFDYKVEEALS